MNDKEPITSFERGILEAVADELEDRGETGRALHLRAIAKRDLATSDASRLRWTKKSASLPPEPGWYLVMLAPGNDWELMSDTPLQVEFDAFKNMPQAFTYSDGWHDGPQDITAAVTNWMPLPAAPTKQ